MKAALVLHGDPPTDAEMALLADCALVVAADGGAEAFLTAERIPDRIVGDLDGLTPDAFKWADAQGIPMERHPVKKDFTDGELALESVLSEGPGSVLILGGHGGHTGHLLGNLRLLERCRAAKVEARMVGNGEVVRFLATGDRREWKSAEGLRFHVMAVDGPTRLALEGTAYGNGDTQLAPQEGKGLSNEVVASPASLTVRSGACLVIEDDGHD